MRPSRSIITNKEKRMLYRLVSSALTDEAKTAAKLKNQLKQIVLLCRLFHKKVEITYVDGDERLKKVIASVWLTTCKKIVLKEGVSIPAANITSIKVL